MLKLPVVVALAGLLASGVLAACGTDGEDAITVSESPAASTSSAEAATVSTEVVDDGAETTTTAAPEDAPLVVEQGMTSGLNSIGTRHTSVGAVLTNPNTHVAAYGVDVVFNLKDAAGTVIDTDSAMVNYIPAGGRRIIAPLQIGFDIPAEPASVEVVAIVGDFAEDNGPEGNPAIFSMPEQELTVLSATLQPDTFGTYVVGQVSNPGTEVAKFSSIDCALRAGGVIVGGVSGGISDSIVPGGTISFKASPGHYPANTDAVECQIHSSF